MRKLTLIALLLAAGCGSYKSDLQMICDSPTNSGALQDPDPSTRAMKIASYISGHIKTSKAKALFSSLATVNPADKGRILREELAKQGIAKCDLIDHVFDEPAKR